MALLEHDEDKISFAGSDRIDLDPRWLAVQRVIASRNFSKSLRLNSFLVYICRCALEDRSDEITEQQIGFHVFSRPADYNPGDDNIVRTTARQLRQRLALYYQEEAGADEIRIDVPRGGYHPIFSNQTEVGVVTAQPGAPLSERTDAPAQKPSSRSQFVIGRATAAAVLCAMLIAGIGLALLIRHLLDESARRSSGANTLWSTLFVAARPTVFVPGDAGLNMYNNLARTQVPLGDYVSGSYLSTPEAQPPAGYSWASLASRRYVSLVDLKLADRLRELSVTNDERYSIKFARDVHPEDLRNANVIVTGAPTYNPWVEMFDNHLNFHLRYDGPQNSMSVLNAKPEGGEPREYSSANADPSNRGYTHGFGYIALTNNLEGNGRVLLIEGSSVAGVDASVSLLLNEARMEPILKKARLPHGGVANFEILLAANFLKSSSPDAQILATRFYPAN